MEQLTSVLINKLSQGPVHVHVFMDANSFLGVLNQRTTESFPVSVI